MLVSPVWQKGDSMQTTTLSTDDTMCHVSLCLEAAETRGIAWPPFKGYNRCGASQPLLK